MVMVVVEMLLVVLLPLLCKGPIVVFDWLCDSLITWTSTTVLWCTVALKKQVFPL